MTAELTAVTVPAGLRAYRPDIDGLRAVAIVSVVAFHVSRQWLPGGYLGVDIFFVLSGYLITSIIAGEVAAGKFSILKFYERRARRILPALFFLLAVVAVFSIFILLPSDLLGFGKSVLATLGFVANIYFWRDSDYFSAAAETKPLLHMWSLGVEEQFYIFLPLLFLMLASRGGRMLPGVVAVLTLASLATDMALRAVGGQGPAFYLLPARAWELGAGAMLALLPARWHAATGRVKYLGEMGALLLVLGLLSPGPWANHLPAALPVVLGTAMLVQAGLQPTSRVNRWISWRPWVFLGLISYSLYLWHWPALVLTRYYLVRDLKAWETMALLGLVLAVSVFSWRVVEKPFRGRKIRAQDVWRLSGLSLACLAAVAGGLVLSRGLPARMSPVVAQVNQAMDTNYRCPVSGLIGFGASRGCVMNLPSRQPVDADAVLLGNSHAQMYAPLWQSIFEAHHMAGLLVPLNACLPTVKFNISQDCIRNAQKNLDSVQHLKRARLVVIGMTWWYGPTDLLDAAGRVQNNQDHAALIAAVDDLIDRLQQSGKQVVLMGPVVQPGWEVASIWSRKMAFGQPVDRPMFMSLAEFRRRFDPVLAHFEARKDIGFARPDRIQCDQGRCHFVLDGHSLFSDSNHLSAHELYRFRKTFEEALSAVF